MDVLTISSAFFFVNNNLTVLDINIHEGYVRFTFNRARFYSIIKLARNYNRIIKGLEPLDYPELYK